MNPFQRTPLWYKDAVIYEVHVKCFYDAGATGVGDFRGLIQKLDYIRDLGVTAIWLLPFYPSPLRDDGYDIQDYTSVNPAYGTLEDFEVLISEAHARGMYVITELVLNHTSDRHPWFQQARLAPKGSSERNFYVWSETKERYPDARIIFNDSESSNWSWDPVAGEYYWHRFYGHQPDLNFDNPEVHTALLNVVDFWFERGVDGMRLDAIPYLYEREGTACENLPETHAFLHKLSSHVRQRFENRMLLAEANQWPEDSVAYFGKGDACDMAFHFPLMPRMYLAVEMEDGFPVTDILEQTPVIPAACQWALFLRNHDELTLEMVTDAERDYMYRVYGKDRRARFNLGIRRRLAPLLRNNRRKIELLNLLLLSLPGTPVLYYGDEIGMGDNLYLGDRDGVRTPMQWNPDRNAGFSTVPAHLLCLPVITDPQFHYETVNVESQENDPYSLLWWTRRMLRLRKRHPAFGRGSLRFLKPNNSHILAFVREWEEETILVLVNLSQHPQTGQLNLAEFSGREPVELSGGNQFLPPGAEPYPVMLGGHDAFWILLRASGRLAPKESRPLFDFGTVESNRDFFHPSRVRVLESLFMQRVAEAPWFRGNIRMLNSVRVMDILPLTGDDDSTFILLLRASFLDTDPEEYAVALSFLAADDVGKSPKVPLLARAVVAGLSGWLCEAEYLAGVQSRILSRFLRPHVLKLESGQISVDVMSGGSTLITTDATPLHLQDLGKEVHFNMTGGYFLRWFRLLLEGPSVDFEILEELALQPVIPAVPLCVSVLRYLPTGKPARVMGYVQQRIPTDRNLAGLAFDNLKCFLENLATSGFREALPDAPEFRVAFHTLPVEMQVCIGTEWAEFTALLGRRLAELHLALARCEKNPDFTPEPQSPQHQQSVYHGIRTPLRRHLSNLSERILLLPDDVQARAAQLIEGQQVLFDRLRRLIESRIPFNRIRIHGDLELERVLFTGKDFVFTGFDGEPWRPYNERRFKFCALRDVATLQHALAASALETPAQYNGAHSSHPLLHKWVQQWSGLSGALVLNSYLDAVDAERFLPGSLKDVSVLLDAFRIERASFELNEYLGTNHERVDAAIQALLDQIHRQIR